MACYKTLLIPIAMIKTGIKRKKIAGTPAAGAFLNIKIFWSYVKYFSILTRVRKCRISVGYPESLVFPNQPIFSYGDNKRKLVLAYFSCF